MNYLNLAKHSSFFKDFELMDFNALLRCLSIRIKVYKAGEIIEYEGNIAKNAYLTLSGKTRTALIDENGKAIPGSISFVPSVAGLIMAGEVIKDLLKT